MFRNSVDFPKVNDEMQAGGIILKIGIKKPAQLSGFGPL